MEPLTSFEHAVMVKLLDGDHEILAILRKQMLRATVTKRDTTGVGFFITIAVSSDVPRIPGNRSFELTDVHAEIDGLKHGAGFVLFVRDGILDALEGFTYGDERWPRTISSFVLSYLKKANVMQGGSSYILTDVRDMETLCRDLEIAESKND